MEWNECLDFWMNRDENDGITLRQKTMNNDSSYAKID